MLFFYHQAVLIEQDQICSHLSKLTKQLLGGSLAPPPLRPLPLHRRSVQSPHAPDETKERFLTGKGCVHI